MATVDWAAIQQRTEALGAVVKGVLKATEREVSEAAGGAPVWSGNYGAMGIDPKHLTAYFVLPKRADVDGLMGSPAWAEICGRFRRRLREAGYPEDRLEPGWYLGLCSQQACDEEAQGNWYHYFK